MITLDDKAMFLKTDLIYAGAEFRDMIHQVFNKYLQTRIDSVTADIVRFIKPEIDKFQSALAPMEFRFVVIPNTTFSANDIAPDYYANVSTEWILFGFLNNSLTGKLEPMECTRIIGDFYHRNYKTNSLQDMLAKIRELKQIGIILNCDKIPDYEYIKIILSHERFL